MNHTCCVNNIICSRIGVIEFSDEVELSIPLDDPTTIRSELRSLENVGGNTNTHDALRMVKNYLDRSSNNRDDAPDIVFFVTDGKNTGRDIGTAASELWRIAEVFAIGAGPLALSDNEYRRELQDIGTQDNTDSHVLFTGEFDMLR